MLPIVLTAPTPLSTVADAALVEVQVNAVLCPAMMVVGVAEKATVGAEGGAASPTQPSSSAERASRTHSCVSLAPESQFRNVNIQDLPFSVLRRRFKVLSCLSRAGRGPRAAKTEVRKRQKLEDQLRSKKGQQAGLTPAGRLRTIYLRVSLS